MARQHTYAEKHRQANREAIATVVGLAITVLVWTVCGFGLAGMDVQVFHTPLWVVGGTIGTWICSIVVVVVLAKKFFVGFDLDDEEGALASAPASAPASAANLSAGKGADHE